VVLWLSMESKASTVEVMGSNFRVGGGGAGF
jgi:hypothetical protein